jgi:hypothetical protein
MKCLILIIPVLTILSACSRPETPPPTTPVQPPTVETTTTPPAEQK